MTLYVNLLQNATIAFQLRVSFHTSMGTYTDDICPRPSTRLQGEFANRNCRPRLAKFKRALNCSTLANNEFQWIQPSTPTDQDRGSRRAPCPRHHLPNGRGRGHRPDGVRHPRCHPQPSSATAMRLNAIRVQIERKPKDRSVRRTENGPAGPGCCGFADGNAQLWVFARRQRPLGAKNACSTGTIK